MLGMFKEMQKEVEGLEVDQEIKKQIIRFLIFLISLRGMPNYKQRALIPILTHLTENLDIGLAIIYVNATKFPEMPINDILALKRLLYRWLNEDILLSEFLEEQLELETVPVLSAATLSDGDILFLDIMRTISSGGIEEGFTISFADKNAGLQVEELIGQFFAIKELTPINSDLASEKLLTIPEALSVLEELGIEHQASNHNSLVTILTTQSIPSNDGGISMLVEVKEERVSTNLEAI